MNFEKAVSKLRQCAEMTHCLIHELHKTDPDNETFTQVGLLDGRDIVVDYLSQNEIGTALEHLLYMIHESDIAFDADQVTCLHELAAELGVCNHYTRANLLKLGVLANTFNVPDA